MKKVIDFDSSHLQFIQQRLAQIQVIEQIVLPLLPVDLRPFCRVANWEGQRLKLAVASPAWATRLRFELPNLQASLAAEKIDEITFYVEAAFDALYNSH